MQYHPTVRRSGADFLTNFRDFNAQKLPHRENPRCRCWHAIDANLKHVPELLIFGGKFRIAQSDGNSSLRQRAKSTMRAVGTVIKTGPMIFGTIA